MLGYLIILFIALPVAELAVLLEAGRLIGVLPTVAVVVVTGAAGAALARSQGFKIITKIKRSLSSGVIPGRDLIEGAMVLGGGVLLLTPGFITDLCGFAALIPVSRGFIVNLIRKKFEKEINSREVTIVDTYGYTETEDDNHKLPGE